MLMKHRFERRDMLLFHQSFDKPIAVKEYHMFQDRAHEEYVTFEAHDGTKYIIFSNAVEFC